MSAGSHDNFVHLHVHTSFSLREGALTIAKLAKFACADRQPAIAISVKNTGTTRYHVIEVENVREDGKFPTVPPMQGTGVSLLKSSRGFAVYQTAFTAAGTQSQHAHEKAFLIVRAEGTVENGGIGGEEPVKMTRPGQWIAMPAAATHYLASPDGPARGIEIEVR